MSPQNERTSEATHGTRGTAVPLFTDVEDRLLSIQELVGRKWIPIIVYHLLDDGPSGFSALKNRIGRISSKMLSESLDDLESAGLVTRELVSERPVRVEYDLTERGVAMESLVAEMVRWAAVLDETVEDEPDDVDDETRRQTGAADRRRSLAAVSLEGK